MRNLNDITVICVTGSVGKTSQKEMIESVLNEKYKNKIVSSKGNSNSIVSSCRNIAKITKYDKLYLQEAGIGGSIKKDTITRIAWMTEPNIAVYTNIKDSHIEWYGTRENIAKEKFTLSDYGKKDGLAIINYDDEILRKHKFIQEVLSFSLKNKKATVYAKNIKITSEGTSFTIVDNRTNEEIDINLSVIGEHHILNSLVAYIIGTRLNLKKQEIIKGLKNYKTSGIRQNLIDIGRYKVLADCYNSSYDALDNILKTFDVIKPKNNGQKLAVIGDIFELGDLSLETHKKIGKLLSEHELKTVIFNGNNTLSSYNEYKKYKDNAIYAKTRKELLQAINKEIKPDDIILFKASHGMNFAEAIDSIFGTEIGEKIDINQKEYKTVEENDLVYKVFKSHATLCECKKDVKKIKLPNEIEGLPLEKIGKKAFESCPSLKEIKLNDNMIRLRGNCFKNTKLEKIEFNSNLKAIGPYTFNVCKMLKEIILPNGLLSIEYRAFYKCELLKKIRIPETVSVIDDSAFEKTKEVIIECKKNSFAESYAKAHNLKIKYY